MDTDRNIEPSSSGTHYFAGAHHLNIGQLEITHIEHQTVVVGQHIDKHGPSEPILDASYLRNRKTSPPDSKCLVGTRKRIIDLITSWASGTSLTKLQHTCWLYGYVGCGKSAIAQTIAEMVAYEDKLAASFFFFRGSGDRSRTKRFASTIATQMQSSIPDMEPFVRAAIKKHPGIYTFPLDTQFRLLVYEPFKAAIQQIKSKGEAPIRPYLIVVDGVDECDDRDEITIWIQGMIAYFNIHPDIPLRVFISSRVQEYIRDTLDTPGVRLINLVDECPKSDIALVAHETFELAGRLNRVIRSYGPRWPSMGQKKRLVEHTDGSFVFMSALLKYILEPGTDHQKRLLLALNLDPGLDGLYAETLSLSESLPHFSTIITAITLLNTPLSISALAELLDIKIFEVVGVLINLHSIFHVPGDDLDPVTVCHSSLYDFLTTQGRSKRFFVAPSHHNLLFEACLRLLFTPTDLLFERRSPARRYAAQNLVKHFANYWRSLGSDVAERKGQLVNRISGIIRSHNSELFDSVVTLVLLTHDNYLSLSMPERWPKEFSSFLREVLSLPMLLDDIDIVLVDLLLYLRREHPSAWRVGYSGVLGPSAHLTVLAHLAETFLWRHTGPDIVINPFPHPNSESFHLHYYTRSFWLHHVYSALDEGPSVLAATLTLTQPEPRFSQAQRWTTTPGNTRRVFADDYRRVNDWATLDEELEDTLPETYPKARNSWRWLSGTHGSYYYFLAWSNENRTDKSITLLDAIAGYTQLALCMSYICQHGVNGRGEVCPPKRFRDGRPYPIKLE